MKNLILLMITAIFLTGCGQDMRYQYDKSALVNNVDSSGAYEFSSMTYFINNYSFPTCGQQGTFEDHNLGSNEGYVTLTIVDDNCDDSKDGTTETYRYSAQNGLVTLFQHLIHFRLVHEKGVNAGSPARYLAATSNWT